MNELTLLALCRKNSGSGGGGSGGGGSTVESSDINGNIKIDGQETTVYDDKELSDKVQELEDNAFSGSYNDLTDKPDIPTIKNSETNGNINVDNSDITVYDDSGIKELITDVQNSIPDVSDLVDGTQLTEAIENVKTMIPDISDLADKDSVTAVSESVQAVSDSVNAINDKIGVAEGIAQLDATGKVPANQLPAFDVVTKSDINGNIQINGTETVVYDETEIKQNIADVKNQIPDISDFVDTDTLTDKIDEVKALIKDPPTITKSTKNGNISVDGKDVEVYNDSSLTARVTAVENKTVSYNDLTDKPDLFSGNYTDLTNKPNIPTVEASNTNGSIKVNGTDIKVYDDKTLSDKITEVKNSAFSGDYNDLKNKPTIPTVPSITKSATNGNIKVGSSEIEVYNDSELQTEVDNKISETLSKITGTLTDLGEVVVQYKGDNEAPTKIIDRRDYPNGYLLVAITTGNPEFGLHIIGNHGGNVFMDKLIGSNTYGNISVKDFYMWILTGCNHSNTHFHFFLLNGVPITESK